MAPAVEFNFSLSQTVRHLERHTAGCVATVARRTARLPGTHGHRVKLISPQFARPLVKSNKNDFVEADAICKAACWLTMRFVTPKIESPQTLSTLHRVRESLVRDCTKAVNQIHGVGNKLARTTWATAVSRTVFDSHRPGIAT